MGEKKLPAMLDEKNVTTDWIEEIFDDWQLAHGQHRLVGFICGCVMSARWYRNMVEWLVSKDMGGDYVSAFCILEQRLKARESDDQGIYSVIEHEGEGRYCIRQRFFFREEP